MTTVRDDGSVSIVDAPSTITIGAGDVAVRERISELLRWGRKHILISLESTRYMDAAGVGELVACYNRAALCGGVVKLVNPNGRVYDLLLLTKLDEVFEVFRDERKAVRSFEISHDDHRPAACYQ